jgi:glycosyltransferase involved in cell wall biosynthesis
MKVLLIASNPFSKIANNGKTFESMFSGFRSEDIAQLYFSGYRPDFDYCSNYFRITDVDILRSLKGSKTCGREVEFYKGGKNSRNRKDLQFVENMKKYISPWCRDFLWKTKRWKTKELEDWYRRFAPDVVVIVGGPYGFVSDIAIHIAEDLKVPLVEYYTDDYLLYSIKRNLFYWFEKRRLQKIFRRSVSHSQLHFAIGDQMAKEYSDYFGCKFLPIMNSVPVREFREYPNHEKLVVSYFGGLHLHRWKMICRLSRLIEDRAEVRVYSMAKLSDAESAEFESSGVKFCGGVSGDMLWEKIYESDVLLHIESDDKYLRKLTGLSVSTKIPEYLMSGRPVLGYGPEEVASMRLLNDNGVGVVISSENNDELVVCQIEKLLVNYRTRAEIGKRGYEFCVEKFDNKKVVAEFMEAINDVVKRYKSHKK